MDLTVTATVKLTDIQQMLKVSLFSIASVICYLFYEISIFNVHHN